MAPSVKSCPTTNTALAPATGINMIENKWTVQGIAQLIGLVVTIIGMGIAIGSFNSRLLAVEESSRQSSLDSRTLIRVESDVAYIKESIQRIERANALASAPIPLCPTERPILVASHCRSYPTLD